MVSAGGLEGGGEVKKVLLACEESQAVTIELRKLGYNAFSCDLLDCSGGHPEWHFKDDVLEVMNGWFDSNEVTINDNFALKFDVWSDEQEYIYKEHRIKQYVAIHTRRI